jgi:maltokinase
MNPSDSILGLEPGVLDEWVSAHRWFAGKARELTRVEIIDAVTLSDQRPMLVLAIVEAVYTAGTHERYHLPLVLAAPGDPEPADVITRVGELTIGDAVNDPEAALALGQLLMQGRPGDEVTFGPVVLHQYGDAVLPPVEEVHQLRAEQTNSSIVYNSTVIMKCYRRLEAGASPEFEMLRFLSAHGFEHVPELLGWIEYRGEVMQATLGVAQRFVRGGLDGWEHTLVGLEQDPDAVLPELAEFGRTVGEMHTTLGSEVHDPEFAREEKRATSLDLTIATIEDEIRDLFASLPEGDDRLAPIAGRGADLAELLRSHQQRGGLGAAIRVHGDLHLGQGLLTEDGKWVLLDFEGEPARSVRDRRRKRSPLRDVAALLRSIAYAAETAKQRGTAVPEGWEQDARKALLSGYSETVDRTMLPGGDAAIDALLSIFELEKAVYELRYELDNRPDWVSIPVDGIVRILEGAPS